MPQTWTMRALGANILRALFWVVADMVAPWFKSVKGHHLLQRTTYPTPNKLELPKHASLALRHGEKSNNKWWRHAGLGDIVSLDNRQVNTLIEFLHNVGGVAGSQRADECQRGSKGMEKGSTYQTFDL